MFSRSQTKNDKLQADAVPSIVSLDLRVSGDLKSDGDIQVDGIVDGDIHSSTLSIGKTAEVNGSIEAEVVRVWGRVNGRIKARQVTLLETAEVSGDIVHESLEVARGAYIEGMVKRDRKQETDRPPMNLVVSDADAMLADAPAEKTTEKPRSSGFPIKAKSKLPQPAEGQ
ncbi:polymer-forming cytoskeletal protein [Fodinicurvata sp. EGI_FJ10296]|uniref:bactofilin family protein n=1 Tax=Fodinicurvata sp. EGI_FJ10296 TaxID=3231908 RepID=UPI00345250B7